MNKSWLILLLVMIISCQETKNTEVLYESDTFKVSKNKVEQGDNLAEVVSPTHLKSNYKSPASTTYSRLVKYKFSINEKDNELPPGADHWVIIGDENESPLVKFGEKPPPFPDQPNTFLPTNYEYTFKVDVSTVLEQFRDKGLSLQQLAVLPETVRLRILLFLKDLRPLEAALGLPPSSNSFLRCRS